MEAISPLPPWLLRIGGHFILPVLIRMSAGSVTCNLSTKPQQLRRDSECSHNDIILDWGRVSGGDRWCRFSSPIPPPPLLQTFWNEAWAALTWTLYIMGRLAKIEVLFFLGLFTQRQFSYMLAVQPESQEAFKELTQGNSSEVQCLDSY